LCACAVIKEREATHNELTRSDNKKKEEMAEQQQGVIGAKDLANLKEQLERMPRDKDRLRLITAAAEGHSFTCVRAPPP
jgi:hypothetical protein